ncbi:hypothetical protein ACFL0P_02605 [Candidatus Omnitrophota bacterium]
MFKNLDKKQKTELIITAIGIVILIFLVISNMQKIQKEKKTTMEMSKLAVSSLLVPISIEEAELKGADIKEEWRRDPFSFAGSTMASPALDGILLNGIVWDKEYPYAIINDDVVKVEDRIGDMRVVEITEKSVILEQDGERYTLELKPF